MNKFFLFLVGVSIGVSLFFGTLWVKEVETRIAKLEEKNIELQNYVDQNSMNLLTLAKVVNQMIKAISTGVDYTQQLNCATKNLYFEAAGEPMEGKMAIAQVVNTRLNKKDKYRKVCDVIYSPHQFSWTDDHIPNEIVIKNKIDQKAFMESISVADMYLSENYNQDPELMNATMYHATWANPDWDYSKLREIKTIGNHVFYEEL